MVRRNIDTMLGRNGLNFSEVNDELVDMLKTALEMPKYSLD